MKYLVAAFLLFFVGVNVLTDASDLFSKRNAYSTECAESLSISVDEHGRYKKSNLLSTIENERNAQCWSMCIAKKMGMFNENEGFLVESYIKESEEPLNETEVRQRSARCAKENPRNADNTCKWFADIITCLQKGQ